VLLLGATGAPEHVREDNRCGHEVSAVVNYTGAVEIPLLPRHLASSSSSTSTAASRPTPATFVGGFSASRALHHPQAQGPHTYVQWPFAPPDTGTFNRAYFQLMHTIIVCF
jgi:hypothetical protein